MKLILGANERINEGLSEIRDLKEDMIQGNNQYSESYVHMVRSVAIVDDIGTETLQPLISRKFSAGSIVCSDTWKAHNCIASREYVQRLDNHGEKQYSDGKGNHINGLEGFWGYLKRKLVSKGGIRREKLPLYLGEYVWRYNHRNENDNVKVKRIIKLLEHEV
jgi:transposase-like protein